MSKPIDTIIFDLGGVLIDWNPRYLYRKIFKTEEEVTWFLENICTSEWNDEQDGGRSFEEATALLVERHPEWREPIQAWYGRWQETINGPVTGTVDVLKEIRSMDKYRIYALTNWSAETFPWALDNFEFLHWFEGIVVSGIEKCKKPEREIFDILTSRYGFEARHSLFIDDNEKNIRAASELGFHAIRFTSPDKLREELVQRAILV
jgi:2-haloacid dehalogenase